MLAIGAVPRSKMQEVVEVYCDDKTYGCYLEAQPTRLVWN